MTTYPSLPPQSASFDFGVLNISEVDTLGGPIRFRHSNQVNGNTLKLQYQGLTQIQVDQIRTHYFDNQTIHGYFDLPYSVWGGIEVVSGSSKYRYTEPPKEEHTGLYYNLLVSLIVIKGLDLLYILDGGHATVPTETLFISLALTGYQPFILNGNGANLSSVTVTHIFEGRGA